MLRALTAGLLGLATAAAAQDAETLRAPNGDILAPGVSVRVYELDRNLARIPTLVEGQTPNVSFVTPSFNLEGDDFGIEDRFFTAVDGFLKIDEPGTYRIALSSDDGGRLYMQGKALVDVDGLHAEEWGDGEIELGAGLHPFLALHFDQSGQAALRLFWWPPGADDYELVPEEHLFAPANQVRSPRRAPRRFTTPPRAWRRTLAMAGPLKASTPRSR